MARTFILGLDDPNRPKRSALVVGPERDDDEVRREFYRLRERGEHPDGWKFLALYGQTGQLDVSLARKTSTEKKPTK